MPKSFLLRFQEECLPEDTPGIHCGTKTATKVMKEGHDLQCIDIHALSRAAAPTTTRVAKDGTDKFEAKANAMMHAITHQSISKATKTMTEVKAESPDNDDRQTVSVRAIPRPDETSNATTMTVTAIRAEATDRDDHRNQPFHAIRSCS